MGGPKVAPGTAFQHISILAIFDRFSTIRKKIPTHCPGETGIMGRDKTNILKRKKERGGGRGLFVGFRLMFFFF